MTNYYAKFELITLSPSRHPSPTLPPPSKKKKKLKKSGDCVVFRFLYTALYLMGTLVNKTLKMKTQFSTFQGGEFSPKKFPPRKAFENYDFK